MTVSREPIHLFLERAPSVRFDDDSTPVFRVVAAVGQGATRRHLVPLTREHASEAEAMAVLSDKILRSSTFHDASEAARSHVEAHEVVHHPAKVAPATEFFTLSAELPAPVPVPSDGRPPCPVPGCRGGLDCPKHTARGWRKRRAS